MPVHHITKTAKATTDKLPDTSGAVIVYAGATECTVDVVERGGAEPTVSAGAAGGAGGFSGVIETQKAEILPQYKLDGAIVWETTTSIFMDGDSV